MSTTGIVLSLTDEQLKDIDEYCEMTQHIESGEQACVSLYELRGLLEELSRLRAENAEMAKDAWRYRWIVKKSTYGISYRQCPELTLPIYAPDHRDGLGDAIDAAMLATQ